MGCSPGNTSRPVFAISLRKKAVFSRNRSSNSDERFSSSSDFSEAISLKKYPSYAEYQQSVARFVPGSHLLWKWLPKRG